MSTRHAILSDPVVLGLRISIPDIRLRVVRLAGVSGAVEVAGLTAPCAAELGRPCCQVAANVVVGMALAVSAAAGLADRSRGERIGMGRALGRVKTAEVRKPLTTTRISVSCMVFLGYVFPCSWRQQS